MTLNYLTLAENKYHVEIYSYKSTVKLTNILVAYKPQVLDYKDLGHNFSGQTITQFPSNLPSLHLTEFNINKDNFGYKISVLR